MWKSVRELRNRELRNREVRNRELTKSEGVVMTIAWNSSLLFFAQEKGKSDSAMTSGATAELVPCILDSSFRWNDVRGVLAGYFGSAWLAVVTPGTGPGLIGVGCGLPRGVRLLLGTDWPALGGMESLGVGRC